MDKYVIWFRHLADRIDKGLSIDPSPADFRGAADEIEKLQKLCSAAYQLAGMVGAPVRFLDALSRYQYSEDLLPVSLEECDEVRPVPTKGGSMSDGRTIYQRYADEIDKNEQLREFAQRAIDGWRKGDDVAGPMRKLQDFLSESTKDTEEMVLVSVCDVCDQLYPKHLEGCEDGSHDMDERPKSWVEHRRGLTEKDS